MTKKNQGIWASVLFLLCAAMAIAAQGQTFTNLITFDGSDGQSPLYVSLVQGVDGNLYGTTVAGGPPSTNCGSSGCGNVFKITPDGTLTTLYNFCSLPNCADGWQPYAGLILGTDGNFYGTTYQGGGLQCKRDYGYCGTVFRITAQGTLTTLYSFCNQAACSDGNRPAGALLEASDGNLYGTTSYGGAYDKGTIFKLAKDGVLTTLHTFCPQPNCIEDGGSPFAGLVQGTDGELYGTTFTGGTAGCCGTVFKMTLAGQLTTLHSFDEGDGFGPVGGLIQAVGGLFYGTTSQGGYPTCGGGDGCGTVFKITADGSLTTLFIFGGFRGEDPLGTLVQGTDRNFYGTTASGGTVNTCQNCGVIFGITSNGDFEPLYQFNDLGAANPAGGLTQATSGKFYGTTSRYSGSVFTLDMGLGPFVKLVGSAGKVGQTGGILGQGFTGTTSVSLNGTPASFTVVSDTFLRATVPVGATTGFVTVTTPSGTLTSNVPFRVIQ